MKRLLILLAFLPFGTADAQTTDTARQVLAFPITDYMTKLSDSVTVVQITMPVGLHVDLKALGLLIPVWSSENRTPQEIAMGRCQLIKGEYFYFAMKSNKGSRPPKAGDLIYTRVNTTPDVFKGVLHDVAKHAVTLKNLEDGPFYDRWSVLLTGSEDLENMVADAMLYDIQHTGKTMKTQMPDGNQPVTRGKFDKQKIFDVMEHATRADLMLFLDYVADSPKVYAGGTFKVSEVWATWVVNGCP